MKFNRFFLIMYGLMAFSLNGMAPQQPTGMPMTPPLTPAVSAQNSPRLKRALEQELPQFPLLDEHVRETKLPCFIISKTLTPQQIMALRAAHTQGISQRKASGPRPLVTEDTPLEDLNASEDSVDMDHD